MNTPITKGRLRELVREVLVEESEYQAFFAKALDWAKVREELESECISYGQMGVTYNLMKLFDDALE